MKTWDVCSAYYNALITGDREIGFFLIHFSKNTVALSKSISWYLVLIPFVVFPACCFQLHLCYGYNSVSTAPPGWCPEVLLLCILWLVAAFQGKKGFVWKGPAVKICSLALTENRGGKDDLTHIAQKAMVLYVMHFIKYLKMHSLESGSLPTYDHCSQGKFSPEFYFQFGFV